MMYFYFLSADNLINFPSVFSSSELDITSPSKLGIPNFFVFLVFNLLSFYSLSNLLNINIKIKIKL